MDLRTAKLASPRILNGEKLYLKRAKVTLPYLVRQAKAKKPIYYSDLAKEIGIPNPRNLNYILGAIGRALMDLGHKNNIDIPPIQCLVVNKVSDLPGEGIGWFIDIQDFKKLTKSEKKEAVNRQLNRIFTFQKWDWVLNQLELKPLKMDVEAQIRKAKAYRSSTTESISHKNLKEFIAKNPAALGINSRVAPGKIEYSLPSSDEIDVVFNDGDLKIGIEVKSRISDDADITRGLFQCVKYKYLIEAEQIVENKKPNSRIILVLETDFPVNLVAMKNILGVEVMDNIKTK